MRKHTKNNAGREGIRTLIACLLTGILCLGLTGCDVGARQDKANSAAEAAEDCLAAFKAGDFDKTMAYMEEGNELLHVLPAAKGECVPELDKAFQAFCAQTGDVVYTVGEEVEYLYDTVNVRVQNRDYTSSIRAAMAEALRSQTEEGGEAFSDVAAWLETGIKSAQMGEEAEYRVTFTKKNGGYYMQHGGSPDQKFLNLLTGGFYEYADLTMSVCTYEQDGYEQRYLIAAVGDNIVAYLMELTETVDPSAIDSAQFEQYKQEYEAAYSGLSGIYAGIRLEGSKFTSSMGIDFYEADQTLLVNSGIVSGAYKTSYGDYLSLSSTLKDFKKQGMECVTIPQYED